MITPFIIAAISADGFIAQDQSQLSMTWTSPEDKKRFIELTKRARVVVMGSKTYETFAKPLKERKNIIYTRDINKKYEGCEVTNEEPQKLITRLEQEGFTEVAICGGSNIYTLFMEAKLIKKVYLTIEAIMFGKGVPLFAKPFQSKLKLVSNTQINENTLLLEYDVIS